MENMCFKNIRIKGLEVIKSFGMGTIILSSLVTILLMVLHNFVEIKSPIKLVWNRVNLFDWTGIWAFILYLTIITIILLAIKYKAFLYGVIRKIHYFTYITIIDKVLASLFIGLILYKIITAFGVGKLSFIAEYYVLLLLIFVFLVSRISKIIRNVTRDKSSQQFAGDDPATEDLLNRKNTVDSLSNAIKNVNVKGSFVIGMYGEWGEGKTTILDMIEKDLGKEKDYIHVIRFEPWYFKNIDSIIKNYFDLICESLGKKMMTLDLMMLISDYRDLLLDSIEGFKINKIISMVIPDFTSRQNVNTVKNKIEDKLKKLDQKVVIFIDDLDRMEREEILLIFKMVKLFSDFDNFIYILSFDKKRIERILFREMKSDKDYLDKIIQVGFILPKVPNETYENILIGYLNSFIKEKEIDLDRGTKDKIQSNLQNISILFDDVRKIKRFYNLLNIKFAMLKTNISFYDFLMITLIEFSFPVQHREILRNKNKFVYYLSDIAFQISSNNINQSRKEYYNEFFSKVANEDKRKILKAIMGSIFTSVNHYRNGYDNLVSNSSNYESIPKKSIEDDQFFDFYFSFEKNDYMILNDKIEEFLLGLDYEGNKNDINSKFVDLFNGMNIEDQVQFLKNIKGYLKDMNPHSYSTLVQILYSNALMYNDVNSGFMDLSVYSHAEGTIAEIIRLVNTNELKKDLLEDVIKNCVDLEFVRGVLYFTKSFAENTGYEHILEECKILFKNKLQKKYIDFNANIFVGNQKRHGMWVLIEYIDNTEEVIEYYYKLVENDPRNIIKFLSIFEVAVNSYQSGKSWREIRFNDKDFNKYFDKEKINEYVSIYEGLNNNMTEEEKQTINLFQEYYKNNQGVFLIN
ncbi:KAP family P-loop NTPase fold protein [Bacillus cereus]|uniref:KAP family P-loop NTPase fold protein n=1 Tax=Bacillus cereus TaxID=1396 RepID=UPI00227B654D|nr:P-loop NTPase fold protein [Bacillus cereus]WAI12303.1 P-loop NTPase fold protein [Bacillus cereus]